MGVPSSVETRRFYRAALQRLEDARILRKAEHTTGAVYLAGYGIECILKALVLDGFPVARHGDALKTFCGRKAHDFEWLRSQYLQRGGARFPGDITRSFTLACDWSTDIRYSPKTIKPMEADAFLTAAERIVDWADGRL